MSGSSSLRKQLREEWTDEVLPEKLPTECPTCGADHFKSEQGVKVHHAEVHGESLAYVKRECKICGERFEVHRSKQRARNCCSMECMSEWRSKTMTGADHPAWKGGRVHLTCEQCGNGYKRCAARADRSRFCSPQCQQAFRVGPNHPRWKGGEMKYGEGWSERKKKAVRKRDGNECQHCGMTNEGHLDEHGISLHVHHIRPAREFDSDRERNAMENLITLCISCHPLWEKMAPLTPVAES